MHTVLLEQGCLLKNDYIIVGNMQKSFMIKNININTLTNQKMVMANNIVQLTGIDAYCSPGDKFYAINKNFANMLYNNFSDKEQKVNKYYDEKPNFIIRSDSLLKLNSLKPHILKYGNILSEEVTAHLMQKDFLYAKQTNSIIIFFGRISSKIIKLIKIYPKMTVIYNEIIYKILDEVENLLKENNEKRRG